ncbi:MAG: hypothetical protein LBV02_06480 [Bacteroidales bacterium]|jgi:hypothetical protein|nr:hypothetical protein [Bacteroidales bacterium]
MKKIKFIIMGIVLPVGAFVLIFSCQKDESNTLSTESVFIEKGLTKPTDPPTTVICCRDYETNYASASPYCCDAGKGCLPCVIVYPPSTVTRIIMELEKLVGLSAKEVSSYFASTEDYLELLPALGMEEYKEYRTALITGKCVIKEVVTNKEGASVAIFQFIEGKKEFAIPYFIL